jgi:hypothetical protein
MNQIDLKEHVRAAVRSNWPDFAQAHPHLAGVIDEDLLVEGAASSLVDDPEYQDAMRQAQAAGAVAQGITDLVVRLVNRWINRLT